MILTERISILNDYIREVNEASGFNTPRFNRDLVKYRKGQDQAKRKSLDFSGYKDGIHPDKVLGGIWMKKMLCICCMLAKKLHALELIVAHAEC